MDAAQSGLIGHNQTTYIEVEVEGPGTLSFYWKVSSEQNYDFLVFNIDGETKNQISGEVNWQQKTYNIEPGTHILRWEYAKDSGTSDGQDRAWLDYVIYEQATPTYTYTMTSTNTFTPTNTLTPDGTPTPILTPDSSIIFWDKMEDANVFVGSCTKEVVGTVSYTTSFSTKAGNCTMFVAGGNYYKYNGIGTQTGTVEFWVKTDSYEKAFFWGQWNNTYSPPQNGYVLGIGVNTEGKITVSKWGYDNDGGFTGNNPIPLNQWVYIAVTFVDAECKIFINGSLDFATTEKCVPAWDMSNYLYVPAWGISSGQVLLDELIISNVLRTEQEIQARYNFWIN